MYDCTPVTRSHRQLTRKNCLKMHSRTLFHFVSQIIFSFIKECEIRNARVRQGWGKLNDLHIFAKAEAGPWSQMVPDVYYIGGFYINSLLTSYYGSLQRFTGKKCKLTYLCLFCKKLFIFSHWKSSDKFESFITTIFDISNLNHDSSIRRKYSNIRVNLGMCHKSQVNMNRRNYTILIYFILWLQTNQDTVRPNNDPTI